MVYNKWTDDIKRKTNLKIVVDKEKLQKTVRYLEALTSGSIRMSLASNFVSSEVINECFKIIYFVLFLFVPFINLSDYQRVKC